jgi:hypothetical protein
MSVASSSEGMQHEDCLCKARQVDDPKRSGRIANTDFSHAWTDARHRPPVVRLVTALDAFELEAGVATGPFRKFAQAIERISEKYDRIRLYQNQYRPSNSRTAKGCYFAKIPRTRAATAGGVA